MATAFTGRATEREAIGELVTRIVAGSPGALVFVGDPGVGKSRLLRDGVPKAGVRRIDIVGYEPDAAVPYGAARPLLRERPMGTASTADAADPQRLSEAIFERLTRDGPTLLVVDDLQWLDAPTRALLHYVARGAVASRFPIGVLAATRPGPESAAALASLERLFAEADAPVVRQLGPLDERDGLALVRAAAAGITADDARDIWRRVGGSPWWLLAVARSPTHDPAEVLGERLRRLSPSAAQALSVLAVAGRPIGRSFAATVLGWTEQRLDEAVRELTLAGLATEGVDVIRPTHDLVREAVVRQLQPEVRREHHARLADAIEASAGGQVQQLHAALGHRREADLDAVDLALRIARSDRRRWLDRDAIADLGRIADSADTTTAAATELAEAVARLASEVGASDLAYERWAALAANGPRETRATARLAAAREAFRLRRPGDVERLVAGPDAPAWNAVEAVEVGALRASSKLWLELDFPAGRELSRSALADARRLDRGSEPARRALWAALRAAYDTGLQSCDWPSLRPIAQEMMRIADELDERTRIEALIYDRMVHRILGEHHQAAEGAAEALQLARRALVPDQMIDAGHFLAVSLFELGRLEEAEQVAREAVALVARVHDYPKLRSGPASLLHSISIVRGPWRTAVAEVEADAAAQPDPHFRHGIAQVAAVALSRIEGARASGRVQALVRGAVADAELAACPRCLREARSMAASALARAGLSAAGHEMVRAIDTDGLPAPLEPAVAATADWAQALLLDDPQARVAALRAALPRVRRARGEIEYLWARIDLARAERGVDQAAAAATLRETGAEAERIGAATIVQLAEQGLRALGHRTWRRTATAGGTDELTERELEVARLVASGESNAAIAAALFVSVKTVERHVSNVFAKLSVRNRADLARHLASTGRTSEGIPR